MVAAQPWKAVADDPVSAFACRWRGLCGCGLSAPRSFGLSTCFHGTVPSSYHRMSASCAAFPSWASATHFAHAGNFIGIMMYDALYHVAGLVGPAHRFLLKPFPALLFRWDCLVRLALLMWRFASLICKLPTFTCFVSYIMNAVSVRKACPFACQPRKVGCPSCQCSVRCKT